jgi:hypothetical protein
MAVEETSEKKGKWSWPDFLYIGMFAGSLLGFAYVMFQK